MALPLRLILFALLILLQGCSSSPYEALLVLSDVAAGGGPSRLKKTTPPPQKQTVSFLGRGKIAIADLYLPRNDIRAGILLVPGAAEKGKDDPRLIAFAETLARARFAVFVPDLPGFRELTVSSADIEAVAGAYDFFASRKELAPLNVGICAFSYAAGPAVLAAMGPQIRDRVDFIVSVGGYYDLENVLSFFTTGWYRTEGEWRHRTPNHYGKWVFVLSNTKRLDPRDAVIFSRMARRRMEDPEAPIDDLAARLSADGKKLYRFVVNQDRQRVPALIADLPSQLLSEIRALNIAGKDLSLLKARVILIHGIDDDIIPAAESKAFDRALPKEQGELFLAGGLAHVDLQPGIRDIWTLWRGVAALLQERDRPSTGGDSKLNLSP